MQVDLPGNYHQPKDTQAVLEALAAARATRLTIISGEDKQEESTNALLKLKVKDHSWRIKARDNYKAGIYSNSRYSEHSPVCAIVLGIYAKRLADTSAIAMSMTTTTLGKTYLVVRIIVKWIFSDINYQ